MDDFKTKPVQLMHSSSSNQNSGYNALWFHKNNKHRSQNVSLCYVDSVFFSNFNEDELAILAGSADEDDDDDNDEESEEVDSEDGDQEETVEGEDTDMSDQEDVVEDFVMSSEED